MENGHDSRSPKVSANLILQIAFSYNTLVEVEEPRSRKASRSESIDLSESGPRAGNSRGNSSEDLSGGQSRVNLSFCVEKDSEGDPPGEDDVELSHLKQVCASLDLSAAFEEFSLHRLKKIQKNIKLPSSCTRYHSRSRLVAVRRLRVITCMIGEHTPPSFWLSSLVFHRNYNEGPSAPSLRPHTHDVSSDLTRGFGSQRSVYPPRLV
jgi:hypothetical protein